MTTVAQVQSLSCAGVDLDRGSETRATIAIVVFAGFTVLCLAAKTGIALRWLFPVLSVLTAICVFRWSKKMYVGLVIWLWFLTPFLRRVVDFRSTWDPSSIMLLAPYLAASVSGIILITRRGTLGRRDGLPFVCALTAIAYGTAIGLTRHPLLIVAQALLNWLIPVVFAYFLYEYREIYTQLRASIEHAFLFGVLLMGAYGVYQFFYLPGWDGYWMQNVPMNSIGLPAPMQCRVFSTMNAPAPFASVIVAGLLLLFSGRGNMRIPAAILGFAALLLTVSRSSWLGLAAGVIWLFLQMGPRQRAQMLLAVLACGTLFFAATKTPIVKDILSDRLRTFSDPNHDVSYLERLRGHQDAFTAILGEPFGEGLGSMDGERAILANDGRIAPHDSTILEALYSLGWLGTLIYLIGVGALATRILCRQGPPSSFRVAAQASLIAYAVQCPFNSVMVGVLGLMVWSFGAMCLADASQQTASI